MPKVSVIIPVYNTSKYLNKCITSILNQSLEDIELIVIDDNSQDKSYEIMQSFASSNPKKIKLLRNEINSGPGKTRNRGLEEAQGEYISFIDSDDYISNDMLEKMYLGCKDNNSDVARVNIKKMFSNHDVSFLGRDTSYNTEQIIIPSENPVYLSKETPGCTNKLFNHDFIENRCFPENLKWEDLPFVIPILKDASSVTILPEPTYFYNVNPKGTTCTDSRKISPKLLDIFDCADIIGKSCITDTTQEEVKEQLRFIQKQNCLQRLRDVLYSDISLSEKKELITLLSSLIEVKYGTWQQDPLYQEYKKSTHLYSLRMNIIENFFLQEHQNNFSETELKNKIKSKIKR